MTHNGGMHAHSALPKFICLIGLAVALPCLAQSVSPVTDATMLFHDPAFGVSFSFPTGWSFSRIRPGADANGLDLSIAYIDDRSVLTGLRGLVTNETLRGIHSWPKTVFSSVEFGYDARHVASAAACHELVRNIWKQESDPVTINGIPYWHGAADGAGVSTEVEEDIYATYVAASQSCVRFDLAVATSHVPGRRYPRELTTREKALIHTSLSNILNSVKITTPSR